MVLGLSKNRWHVPVQILGTVFFVVGYFLAHAHAGRNYVRKLKTPHSICTDAHSHTFNIHNIYQLFSLCFVLLSRNLILHTAGLHPLLYGQ